MKCPESSKSLPHDESDPCQSSSLAGLLGKGCRPVTSTIQSTAPAIWWCALSKRTRARPLRSHGLPACKQSGSSQSTSVSPSLSMPSVHSSPNSHFGASLWQTVTRQFLKHDGSLQSMRSFLTLLMSLGMPDAVGLSMPSEHDVSLFSRD